MNNWKPNNFKFYYILPITMIRKPISVSIEITFEIMEDKLETFKLKGKVINFEMNITSISKIFYFMKINQLRS